MVPSVGIAGRKIKACSRDAVRTRALQRKARSFRLPTKRREAERRQAHPSMSAPHSQTLPPESVRRQVYAVCANRLLCAAAVPAGTARLSALRPRCLPRKSMPRLSPGRASREREGTGVTRTIDRAYSDAPRTPVIMPAGRCPEPPGSGVTKPARRNRTRSVSRPSPVTSLRERDETMTFERQRKVK
jgi:hypothetical protein